MTRIVVAGSGIAGLTAALHAARSGAEVTVVTKAPVAESNTRYAQGGIAGALFGGDDVAIHAEDTLRAGAGLCAEDAVRVLTAEAPARLRELLELEVAFDREPDRSLLRGLEAAHSAPRILHAGGDATGREIQRALTRAVADAGIEVIEHAFVTGIAMDGAAGATGRDITGVELLTPEGHRVLDTDAVVLATGGAGQLYARTTNPAVATGDGIAAAIRAGAAVRDMEFVQFHPTVLAAGPAFLVSEAVRGEGAVLIDQAGRRFAFDAHPDGELAPRDVVARAIADRMAAQGGHPVLLDATGLGAETLGRRFPTIDRAVRERGLDWAREPIPVAPAAHFLMGGVVTDLQGRTGIPGLYAVGETARTGVHGANRLASNSLLEGAVFGARVGAVAARDPRGLAEGIGAGRVADDALRATAPARPAPGTAPRSSRSENFSRAALQELMWRRAGLIRDGAGLAAAARTLRSWRGEAPTPRTAQEHEDANMLLVAETVVQAALRREISVGAHFRSDAVTSAEPIPETAC